MNGEAKTRTGQPLQRVLLGVSGGIAAYKSPDLVRRLKERGCDVRVVLTRGAQQFVTPLTFQAVSGNSVHTELMDADAEAGMGHIELARWAEKIVIAPATADLIARLAQGRADDLLTTLCLASSAPLVIAPAMNRGMWQHPATQENIETLKHRGVDVLGPGAGEQACGDVGEGRMLEPLEIAAEICQRESPPLPDLSGLKVLITAGPTREPIDPVRYITNRSSGLMGFSIAEVFAQAGAAVTLVAGPVRLDTPANVHRVDVETAAQMHEVATSHAAEADIFVGCAAVADYRPANVADQKIKKGDSAPKIELIQNADILADISTGKNRPFCVGFAAETENLGDNAQSKLQRKQLDMIAANCVGENLGFDSPDNALSVYWADGEQQLDRAPKPELARQLVLLIHKKLNS